MNTTKLGRYRQRLDAALLERRVAIKSYQTDKVELERSRELLAAVERAQKILQELAAGLQERAHKNIATLVSQCLTAVFDDPYEFRITFEQKRGKTEAHLVFLREGEEVNPLKASGGGVVDVASFALRLSCVLLAKPKVRKLIVLDEPFKFLSEEYVLRVRAMLDRLAKDLRVQFIIVTHLQALKGANSITLR